MCNDIRLKKIWESEDFFEVEITCSNKNIIATSRVYVNDNMIDNMCKKIRDFFELRERETFITLGTQGNFTTPSVSFSFTSKDSLGHIRIEAYMELDDDLDGIVDYTKHNCCFNIDTEIGMLPNFCDKLIQLKENSTYIEVSLND